MNLQRVYFVVPVEIPRTKGGTITASGTHAGETPMLRMDERGNVWMSAVRAVPAANVAWFDAAEPEPAKLKAAK